MSAGAAKTLGVVAGDGDLPRRIAEAGRAAGREVVVAALDGFAGDWVAAYPHVRVGMGQFGAILKHFRAYGVEFVTLAGGVTRPDFADFVTDDAGARIMPGVLAAAAQGDDAILRAVLDAFAGEGFEVAGADALDPDLVAEPGVLGACGPGAEHEADIEKAVAIARAIGRLDVGQGAVVCDGVVLAVEAQEGTDRMLARVAELPSALRGAPDGRRGVLAKVPKPIQDRRVDLPTIGPRTIEGVDRAGLAGIAIEAGGALIVDREETARLADAAGVFVVSLSAPGEPSST